MSVLDTTTPRLSRGHRPLNWLAVISGVAAVNTLVLYFTDQRELLGVSVWEKPLKFLISTVVYALTFSWFYSLTTRARRVAWWCATLITSMLVLELAIIIGLASAGLTSHFNVSSAFHITMWSLMAAGISTLWVLSFALGALLWRSPTIETTLLNGIRWGLATGLAGMGLAFTMTSPTPDQLARWEGIAGAHTVGASDGGPGLPFIGWSIVGGDLRVSHFLGLHGLQVLPLLALLLVTVLSSKALRRALIHGAGVSYSLLIVVVYLQALAGEPVVAPSTLTLLGYAGAVLAGLVTAVAVMIRAREIRRPDLLSASER